MTIDINQFWNLLSESQLVNVSQVQTLFSEYSADKSKSDNTQSLAKWLVQRKAISSYQAEIISAGHSGPFRYGNYSVHEPWKPGLSSQPGSPVTPGLSAKTGPTTTDFVARHLTTGFPVLLQFFPGNQPRHLQQWVVIQTRVEQLTPLVHPGLLEVFESVVLRHHRFVVGQLPRGSQLSEKLPPKARLPWQKACGLIAHAADALHQLHTNQLVHGSLSPRQFWLDKDGLAQIGTNPLPDLVFDLPESFAPGTETRFGYAAPETFAEGSNPTAASDIYSLGCTLYRILSGRLPFDGASLTALEQQHARNMPPTIQHELPDQAQELLNKMLAKMPTERPDARAVANVLGLLAGQADKIQVRPIADSPARSQFRNSLRKFLPESETTLSGGPMIATETDSTAPKPEVTAAQRAAKIEAATSKSQRRKKNRWLVPAAIGAAMLAFSAAVVVAAFFANQTDLPPPAIVNQITSDDPKVLEIDEPNRAGTDLAALPPNLRPTIIQNLIEDDSQSLWESPTNGPPIEFAYLPASPKILLVVRPAELVQSEEGQLLLKSFGPEIDAQINAFQKHSGLELENVQQLIVSLHTNPSFEYEAYYQVRMTKPIESQRLIQFWNRPAPRELENGQTVFESPDDWAYYVLHDSTVGRSSKEATGAQATESADGQPTLLDESAANEIASEDSELENDSPSDAITWFAFGHKRLVDQVASTGGADTLSGSLRMLADWTDRDRHLNLLFLRNAVFNDEGQKLMGERLLTLNRELSIAVPDDVRGGLISLHLDQGSYFELMLDKNFDLKAMDLMEQMVKEFRSRRDQLMQFVTSFPPSPYWDQVRFRYAGMLANFHRNLRWNIEHGEVVANCWLPPMAAHNLIAASELAISFSSGATSPPVTRTNAIPQSLADLLEIKRDLNIANPPDLNVLMSDLVTEIQDDYGNLPFPLNIRLMGAYLEKEGITKNQRPSELVMDQKTLSEILTEIMTSANPSKDISGASDPNCKLVWVIGEDPEIPGQQAILITTRSAAAERSLTLPPAFRAE